MKPMEVLDVKPTSISWEVSTKCSLDCTYCHREKSSMKNLAMEEFDLYNNGFGDEFKERYVFCGIGESFLNLEFYQMIEKLDKQKVTIITSGTLSIDFERLMDTKRVDTFIFSIDSATREGVREICGENFSYDNLVENIQLADRLRKARRQPMMMVMNATINVHNVNELESLYHFARKKNFDVLHLSLPWGEWEFINENLGTMKTQIKKIRRLSRAGRLYFENPFVSYCCLSYGKVLPYMNLQGDVFPCGYALNQNYKVGNMNEESFEVMWNSDAYIRFKQGELCKSCYMFLNEQYDSGKEAYA